LKEKAIDYLDKRLCLNITVKLNRVILKTNLWSKS